MSAILKILLTLLSVSVFPLITQAQVEVKEIATRP
jgi:hypothetical protein